MIANLDTGASATRATALHWLSEAVRTLVALTQNGMALMGLAIGAVVLTLMVHTGLRDALEHRALTLLLERQEAKNENNPFGPEPLAAERATAAQPSTLPKAQANVAYWPSRKYLVAPEPLSVLVAEAFDIGEKIHLDPTLILAVMAIESRFNPFSQSAYGAQGLMQVLTRVHTDKYADFGGKLAAFDPVSNLRVGVQVLQDCIRRAGSIEGGLKLYVGAVSVDGSDYVTKVMAEHIRIRDVALGKSVPLIAPAKAPATPAPQPMSLDAESAHSQGDPGLSS
jgi:hypothetical protein